MTKTLVLLDGHALVYRAYGIPGAVYLFDLLKQDSPTFEPAPVRDPRPRCMLPPQRRLADAFAAAGCTRSGPLRCRAGNHGAGQRNHGEARRAR